MEAAALSMTHHKGLCSKNKAYDDVKLVNAFVVASVLHEHVTAAI